MYAYSLGIMRDENHPGFKHFVLSPRVDPTGQMTFARGYYDSLYGRIESAWEVKDGEVRYSFTVPANTSATLYLPVASADKVTENGRVLQAGKEGVKEVVWAGGYAPGGSVVGYLSLGGGLRRRSRSKTLRRVFRKISKSLFFLTIISGHIKISCFQS